MIPYDRIETTMFQIRPEDCDYTFRFYGHDGPIEASKLSDWLVLTYATHHEDCETGTINLPRDSVLNLKKIIDQFLTDTDPNQD